MHAKPVLAAGVDAGSARTRCVILLLENACVRLLGFGEARSQGWKRGRITDRKAVTDSILHAVREAESRAQSQIESAVFGIGGGSIASSKARGGFEIGFPRELEQDDVNLVVDRASHVQLQEDELVLHLFPQDFRVDGRPGHRNPRGVIGSRLEVYVHLVTGSAQEHYGLVGAANEAHLVVEETVFEAIAAAYASGIPERRDESVVVIDIGAHSTEAAIYCGDSLLYSTSLPVCADHFTLDVAHVLKLSLEDATWIKEQHGCAMLGLTADHSLIELPSTPDRGPREATRGELNRILEARAVELFGWVQRDIELIGMTDMMLGCVLAGGGSRLHGMCDLAERILGCQARLGLPAGILDWAEDICTPEWTTAAGLAMYSARLKLRAELDRRKTRLFAGVFK
ncbi:MAG: cell division protein FtsA [Bryobacteraceae bacterium]